MRTLDVHPIIDNARFSAFHWMVMAWCGLLLIFDGYDLFIYGVVLPVIMKEWGLTPLQAGALGSYALFGMMFGALAFGSLADCIGRKKGIAICFALFSGATILNGFASSPSEFGIYRFIAGLGCGGLMPNAVALMNEYAPKRLRSTLVAVMFSGYSLGGMLSAGVGIFMLPRFGWESMFFAAAVPLLLLPVILYYLPESIGFLVRQGRTDEARQLLKRLAPDCDVRPGDQLQASDPKGKGGSVLELFRNGLATRTLALWLAMFITYVLMRRLQPRYAVAAVLGVGALVTVASGALRSEALVLELASPHWITPQFSLAAVFSLALPMVLVALTGQFMPGMAVLRNAGYTTPASPLISASALGGALLAPFGCHGLNLAAVTASLCTGHEAHENPRRRYVAAVAGSALYLLLGIGGATLMSLFAAFPAALIAALAGLALYGAISEALVRSLAEPSERDAGHAPLRPCAVAPETPYSKRFTHNNKIKRASE
ncbi:MFS transporter [Pseudomonas plecoglossicida]|nr:MFS transporter [Pseudomonas plecoglossicida]EPB96450.1 major facilitator superfamily transporter [Pseudomonas plecoglossicida NB2011]